jgi:hypothetical protein
VGRFTTGFCNQLDPPVVASNDKQPFKLEQLPRYAFYGGDDDGTTILFIRANQASKLEVLKNKASTGIQHGRSTDGKVKLSGEPQDNIWRSQSARRAESK